MKAKLKTYDESGRTLEKDKPLPMHFCWAEARPTLEISIPSKRDGVIQSVSIPLRQLMLEFVRTLWDKRGIFQYAGKESRQKSI